MKIKKLLRQAVKSIVRATINPAYCKAAEAEEQFREEMERLFANLNSNIQIVKASKYTENCREYAGKDRLRSPPPDYLAMYKKQTIAAVEVTTGSEGYSYKNSKIIQIDEKKLQRMDAYNEGYVVEKVLVEEPHFIWACRDDIRSFTAENGTHKTNIKIWKPTLNGLAELLIELAKREDELLEPSTD